MWIAGKILCGKAGANRHHDTDSLQTLFVGQMAWGVNLCKKSQVRVYKVCYSFDASKLLSAMQCCTAIVRAL